MMKNVNIGWGLSPILPQGLGDILDAMLDMLEISERCGRNFPQDAVRTWCNAVMEFVPYRMRGLDGAARSELRRRWLGGAARLGRFAKVSPFQRARARVVSALPSVAPLACALPHALKRLGIHRRAVR